jgi:hypothetical protein
LKRIVNKAKQSAPLQSLRLEIVLRARQGSE